MWDIIRSRAAVLIVAALGLGTCAGCAGNPATQTQGAIERVYSATDGPLEDMTAGLDIFNEGVLTVEEQCFDVPEAERAPLATCEAAVAAVNATEGLVETGSILAGEAEAAIIIYETYDQAKAESGLIAAQEAATAAMSQALTFWMQRKPRIERAAATIGKVSREDPE